MASFYVNIDTDKVLDELSNDEIIEYLKDNIGLKRLLCIYFSKRVHSTTPEELADLVLENTQQI